MTDLKTLILVIEQRISITERNNQAFVDLPYDTVGDALAMLKEQQQQIWELQDQVEYLTDKQKKQDEEHRRLLSWLGKFCRHIDNGDAWLTDEENIAFFKEKMKQQFGWDTDLNDALTNWEG